MPDQLNMLSLNNLATLLVELDGPWAQVTLTAAVLVARYGMEPSLAADLVYEGEEVPPRAREIAASLLAAAKGVTPIRPTAEAADLLIEAIESAARADYAFLNVEPGEAA
jgi:hypothetical protein